MKEFHVMCDLLALFCSDLISFSIIGSTISFRFVYRSLSVHLTRYISIDITDEFAINSSIDHCKWLESHIFCVFLLCKTQHCPKIFSKPVIKNDFNKSCLFSCCLIHYRRSRKSRYFFFANKISNLFRALILILLYYPKKIAPEEKEIFENILEECRKQNNATEADMESIMNGQVPETPAAKCTMTCTMKEFGIVINLMTEFIKTTQIAI